MLQFWQFYDAVDYRRDGQDGQRQRADADVVRTDSGRVPDARGTVRPPGRDSGRVPDARGTVRPLGRASGRVPDARGTVRPPGCAGLVPVRAVDGRESTDGRPSRQPEAVRRRRHPAATGRARTGRPTHFR